MRPNLPVPLRQQLDVKEVFISTDQASWYVQYAALWHWYLPSCINIILLFYHFILCIYLFILVICFCPFLFIEGFFSAIDNNIQTKVHDTSMSKPNVLLFYLFIFNEDDIWSTMSSKFVYDVWMFCYIFVSRLSFIEFLDFCSFMTLCGICRRWIDVCFQRWCLPLSLTWVPSNNSLTGHNLENAIWTFPCCVFRFDSFNSFMNDR